MIKFIFIYSWNESHSVYNVYEIKNIFWKKQTKYNETMHDFYILKKILKEKIFQSVYPHFVNLLFYWSKV